MGVQSSALADDERLVVSPRRAWHMLGIGNTHGYQLLAAGELDSYLDGRSRKITVASIRRYIEKKLANATPHNNRVPRRRGRLRKNTSETAMQS
jgi:hypothetical protein